MPPEAAISSLILISESPADDDSPASVSAKNAAKSLALTMVVVSQAASKLSASAREVSEESATQVSRRSRAEGLALDTEA